MSRHLERSALPGLGPSRAGAILLAAIVALACSVEERVEPAPVAPDTQLSEVREEAPPVPPAPSPAKREAPKADPAPEAPEAPAEPPQPALDDLMRLPASVGQRDPVTGRWRWAPPAVPDSETKEEQRVRLELDQRRDGAKTRPSATRSRTDAGVSVDVAESVRIRGGVRLEQESGKEAKDPVPTVGIEKRF